MTHDPKWLGLLVLVAACAPQTPTASAVRPGIEVLLSDSSRLIEGRRVGLLTNQTGVDRQGVDDLTQLLAAGAQVTAIFAPEHGYRGMLDTSVVGDTVHADTGIEIFSLYGTVRAPTPAMLDRIDVLLVDLQDIGARPYTYISTALLAMEAAAAQGVRVLVLDRPNPVGGELIQGPLLDTAEASFVGMLPVPLRHGMTIGELARLGNDARGIGAELTVVPADGWRRDVWFDGTGLPWVRPSPSMPSQESATHYPGTVLFEATNLSVGRGTPIAFQVIGAPWLDVGAVLREVGPVDGLSIDDTTITPRQPPDGKHDGVTIPAVRLAVRDRAAYDPVATAIRLLAALVRVHGDSLRVSSERFRMLAGDGGLWPAIEAGTAADEIVAGWERPLARFRRARAAYLLYR